MSQFSDQLQITASTKKSGGPADGTFHDAAVKVAAPQPKHYDVDEVIKSLKRIPLFMTDLDEAGDDNPELEGLRQLAYEGTRTEVAGNFREQGNEHARVKNWSDAKKFYTKALAAIHSPSNPPEQQELPDVKVVEIDEEAEAKKEREIEEACYVNRALCNLELSMSKRFVRTRETNIRCVENYGWCNLDCASTLKLNPRNIKAWYRSASACLALDKIPQAEDACSRGLEIDSNNNALKALETKIQNRKTHLEEVDKKRKEREERAKAEANTLKLALKSRNISTRSTDKAPELEDAALKLSNPLDSSSTLLIPVLLLYPLHAQSDFIKAFEETQSLAQHFEYIFEEPLQWDQAHEYTADVVECYIETSVGGLIKAGKKLPLSKILGSGKVEVVDGLLRVYVVPKMRAHEWIEDFKAKRPKVP